MFFAVLALADLALMIYLRRQRRRRVRLHRMMRSLEIAVQRENAAEPAPLKRWFLRHAG